MIYEDFPLIPLILVITVSNRKTLFCVFFRFRNLSNLKLIWDFFSVNILSREPPGEEVNEMGPRDQPSTGGAGRATHAHLGLRHGF
jgi:hypothetical protein